MQSLGAGGLHGSLQRGLGEAAPASGAPPPGSCAGAGRAPSCAGQGAQGLRAPSSLGARRRGCQAPRPRTAPPPATSAAHRVVTRPPLPAGSRAPRGRGCKSRGCGARRGTPRAPATRAAGRGPSRQSVSPGRARRPAPPLETKTPRWGGLGRSGPAATGMREARRRPWGGRGAARPAPGARPRGPLVRVRAGTGARVVGKAGASAGPQLPPPGAERAIVAQVSAGLPGLLATSPLTCHGTRV